MAAERQVRLQPLGGIGRFGGNGLVVAVEPDGPALVVDCGVRFLDPEEAPGFDFGLCDTGSIAHLGDRLLGYIITHGHEDHIGALPYAFDRNPGPVFATGFTAHRIEHTFRKAGAPPPDNLTVVVPGQEVALGPFRVRWLAVSHSLPDAACVVIDTPAGRLVHSGDFRVDGDPLLGPPTDLAGLEAVGDDGVDVLLADSTGAATPGPHPGERSVVEPLLEAVRQAHGHQVFVVTYGSHVQRVAACAEVARALGRSLVVSGRSLAESVRAARDLGLFAPDDVLLAEGQVRSVPPGRVLAVVTGSQAEPMSGLDKLAQGAHPRLSVRAGDVVIHSARVIPGNERRLAATLDRLAARGVRIVDGRGGRHVSGHGSAGDLEALLLSTRPRTFVAIHGGHVQLQVHRDLVRHIGLDDTQVVDLTDGQELTLGPRGVHLRERPPGPPEAWVQGRSVVDDPRGLAQVRRRMAQAGTLVLLRGEDGYRVEGAGLPPILDEKALDWVARAARHLLGPRAPRRGETGVAALGAEIGRRYGASPHIVVVDEP